MLTGVWIVGDSTQRRGVVDDASTVCAASVAGLCVPSVSEAVERSICGSGSGLHGHDEENECGEEGGTHVEVS